MEASGPPAAWRRPLIVLAFVLPPLIGLMIGSLSGQAGAGFGVGILLDLVLVGLAFSGLGTPFLSDLVDRIDPPSSRR